MLFTLIFEAFRLAIASWRVMIDDTVRRIHRKAVGAGKDRGPQAIGLSRVGVDTKTVAPVDVLGMLIEFVPLPDQASEPGGRRANRAVEALIEGVPFEAFTADKACDAGRLSDNRLVLNPGMKVAIPTDPTARHGGISMTRCTNCIAGSRNSSGRSRKKVIAARCDKTDCGHEARRRPAGTLEVLK